MTVNAFTCTGPYAILIMLGIKRVENRNALPCPAKGRCAISCSKRFCAAEYGEFVRWASRALKPEDFERVPAWGDVKDWPGKVVGCCDYEAGRRLGGGLSAPRSEDAAGTVVGAEILWDEGYPYWWELSDVVALDEPIACRGNVGMWTMPDELARRVTAADEATRGTRALPAPATRDASGTVNVRRIASAAEAAAVFRRAMAVAGDAEGSFVLPLDGARRMLGEPALVALGTAADTTEVRVQDVFREAFRSGAEAIIVAHNHPGGTLRPSREDVELTRRLFAAADLLGVRMLDHLIVTKDGFATIKREGV